MNINIENMTEYDLLKLAKLGAEAEIEDECQLIAGDCASRRRIDTLQGLIRQYDVIDAALDELRRRKKEETQ